MDDTRAPSEPFPAPPWWVVDSGLVLIVAMMAFAPFPDARLRPDGAVSWVMALVPIVVIPLRRRLPFVALGAAVLLFSAVALSGLVLPGTVLALFVTVFRVAVRTSRRVSVLTALIVVGVVIVVGLVASLVTGRESPIVPLCLLVALAAAIGDGARSRRAFIIAMTERAERAEETRESEARRRVSEERLRIARDLHDTVAHQISVISLNAGVASSSLPARPEKAQEALGTIRAASRTVLGEIGDLLRFLRADEQSEPPRPQQGLGDLERLIAGFGEAGLAVTLRSEGRVTDVPPAASHVAYQVAQEGLTNALKHGAERRAHLLVEVGQTAATVVVTNPVADDLVSADGPGSGLGLIGLRERLASANGTIEAGRSPGGFTLTAVIPLAHGTEPS